jgi:hypothetical protein
VVKAAAYISGEKLESYKEEKVYNYARRQDVLFRKIMAPPGAPECVRDRESLWNIVDRVETRWNARLQASLPITFRRWWLAVPMPAARPQTIN